MGQGGLRVVMCAQEFVIGMNKINHRGGHQGKGRYYVLKRKENTEDEVEYAYSFSELFWI